MMLNSEECEYFAMRTEQVEAKVECSDGRFDDDLTCLWNGSWNAESFFREWNIDDLALDEQWALERKRELCSEWVSCGQFDEWLKWSIWLDQRTCNGCE